MKFEEAVGRLEKIVEQMEEGNLTLEESLKSFEEGIGLSRKCIKILNEVERKVEILLKDPDGQERLAAFHEENGKNFNDDKENGTI